MPVDPLLSDISFLSHCLGDAGQDERQKLLEKVTDPRCDWEALIKNAASELVLPALHSRLEWLRLVGRLPEEMQSFFFLVRELSLERNNLILREALAVTKLLNSIGVEPVVLKGVAYLLAGVYPEPSSRFISDIDILVPSSDLRNAVALLHSHGYSQPNPGTLPIGHHHYPALLGPRNIPVEIHHSLGARRIRSILSASEMHLQSSVRMIDGVNVRLPSPSHLIAHHILHSQIGDGYFSRVWPTLRSLYDFALLLGLYHPARIDWESVEDRFRRNRSLHIFQTYLLLFQQILGVDSPCSIKSAGLTALEWVHIQFLRQYPTLRRIDPIYLYFAALAPRFELIPSVLRLRGGWKMLLAAPLRATFYRNLLAAIERR